MFSDSDLKNSGLLSHKGRLKNKHSGGSNQQKGTRYEDRFALAQIARYVSKEELSVKIASQVNCFVDDFVAQEQGSDFFYQLKNTSRISWSKNLRDDFMNQAKLCSSRKKPFKPFKPFKLFLVVSNSSLVDKLAVSNVPQGVSVQYFPYHETVEQEVNDSRSGLSKNLKTISALKEPSTLDLSSLGKTILSEWIDKSQANKFISVGDVIKKVQRKHPTPIKDKWSETKEWKKAKNILDNIPQFEYTTEKGIFEYQFGKTDKGTPITQDERAIRNFTQRIIKTKPKTFWELEELF